MPIDCQLEQVLSLKDAAKAMPLIDGKRPHVSTIWRWCRRGLNGVQLDYSRLGCRIVTSREAIARFAIALAVADTQLTSTRGPRKMNNPKAFNRAASKSRAEQVLAKAKI